MCDLAAVPVPAVLLLGAPVPGASVPGALVPGASVPGALVHDAPVPGALVPVAQGPDADHDAGDIPIRWPVMILPFYSGISDGLQKMASNFGLQKPVPWPSFRHV